MTRIVSDERIRQDCELRLRLAESGFAVRTVVPPGTVLYDPIVGWADPDGSLVVSDHGPQVDPGRWDPAKGSGGLYRLHPDDRLEIRLEGTPPEDLAARIEADTGVPVHVTRIPEGSLARSSYKFERVIDLDEGEPA